MIQRTLPFYAAIFFLVVSCHTTKKTPLAVNTEKPVVIADTTRPVSNKAPEKEIYRESNPKLSDLIHTRLDVNFDWSNCRMNGIATLELKQHFYPSSKLYLNAKGMDINKVEVFELAKSTEVKKEKSKTSEPVIKENQIANAGYKYENDSIKIDLGRVFGPDENYLVVINYIAKPNELGKKGGSRAIMSDKGLYFVNPKGENQFEMPQIWTQGETQSNSVWFPTIDSPNSKTTQDIFMTVEDKYTTLSNGSLIDSKKNTDGTRTDHWNLDQPHAPYLAMMAVGQFKKVVDEPWNGKEISYYVEKQYEPHAKGIFGNTREMIDFYSKRLGVPYAWPKYAQIAAREYVSGAMENTSATLHGDMAVYQTTRELLDGNKGEDVIAHELFHQWFGDLVTSESWSNLPLNESFATYGEYLWNEYKYGRDAADLHHTGSREGYLRSGKEVNLIRFNVEDREDMFDAFSYNKGGQVLHMLRKAVGDDAFFASLKKYLETNKFKSAEIHNLRLAFEEITGQDMNWFFNEWFLNKGRPVLKVSQKFNTATGEVELSVEQKQDFKNVPLYKLPVDIDIYVDGKPVRTRIWIDDQKQTFKIKATGKPQLVNFDAERQLLCDLEYPKTDEEYIFQYKNAPLFNDRLEALKALETKLNDDAIFALFKSAGIDDKFHGIRNYAITRLESAPKEKMADVKTILLNVYKNDKKTRTRAKALAAMNRKFIGDPDLRALNESALSEMSYAINGEALEGLAKIDVKLAMEKSKAFEGENGKDVIFQIAELYSNYGGDDQISFFQNSIKFMNGFEIVSFCNFYTKTAKRCTTSAAVLAAAKDLESIAKSSDRFIKYGGTKGLKDLSAAWEGKEKATKAKLEAAKTDNKDAAALEKEHNELNETKDSLQKMYQAVK